MSRTNMPSMGNMGVRHVDMNVRQVKRSAHK